MKRARIGNGYDVHAFTEGDLIVLCGVKIKHNMALKAHSDGDVAVHSVCDAILGALSRGDIGSNFPDNDLTYKDIDSLILLEKCNQICIDSGYEIGNLDCTIVAQEPKLRPYIDRMRETLARTLLIDTEQVSVKATTTEQLGFAGRKEGIAAYASVLLFPKEN